MKVIKGMMIHKVLIFVILALILVSITSCDDKSLYKENKLDLDLKELEEVVAGDGYSALLEKLEEEDYQVKEKGLIYDPLLRGLGRYLILYNNQYLGVYEYTDDQLLYEDIYSIDEDGYKIDQIEKGKITGIAYHEWGEQPHYYLYENLIILYAGSDSDFLTFLKEISDVKIIE